MQRTILLAGLLAALSSCVSQNVGTNEGAMQPAQMMCFETTIVKLLSDGNIEYTGRVARPTLTQPPRLQNLEFAELVETDDPNYDPFLAEILELNPRFLSEKIHTSHLEYECPVQ